MSFAAAIKAFEEKALLAANKAVCNAFELVSTQLVARSPDPAIGNYSKGHLANQWHPSVGSPSVIDDGSADANGIASFTRIRAFTASSPFYRKDNVVFITNGANYAYRADKLGWPMGEGANGWVWNGATAYGFTGKAINTLKGHYM